MALASALQSPIKKPSEPVITAIQEAPMNAAEGLWVMFVIYVMYVVWGMI